MFQLPCQMSIYTYNYILLFEYQQHKYISTGNTVFVGRTNYQHTQRRKIMPTLISPGVSVTVTDESFYVPASAPTVPMIIIATAENKLQPNGISAAIGTQEHDVIRTVTSLTQSSQLYGIPKFLQTVSGEAQHGDARNEYGLLALNQFLGIGNRAYVVRANVNLNDDRNDIINMWLARTNAAAINIEVLSQEFINEFNAANGYVTGNPLFKETITRVELVTLMNQVMVAVYDSYNFNSTIFETDFESNHNPLLGGTAALNVYDATYTTVVASFLGFEGAALDWETNSLGSFVGHTTEWLPSEANTFLSGLADDFAFTVEFLNSTSLGANDPARRSAIVTALQATVNSPDIRSEAYEFNLVLCPGYHELVDEMATLVTDISNEAVVIADSPMNMDPDAVVVWMDDPVSGRVYNANVAYYYSHGYGSNLDGTNVLGAASGVALRTIAFSDDTTSAVWFAPAGAQRGVVTGVSQMGYYTGIAGSATQFNEAVLNVGQRDNMYKDPTKLNPITFLPGRGIVVMGQKTSPATASALDRINVVRLMAHIKRQLRKNTFAFVFEPNDQLTRDNLKAMVDNFLGDLVVRRGLYDFASVCDESNNTPDRVDRNEMYIDIALKPVKAAEFIYVPIRVLSTGASL